MEREVFSDQAKTIMLSRHNAEIVSKQRLSTEQELILRRLDRNKEMDTRVVGRSAPTPG